MDYDLTYLKNYNNCLNDSENIDDIVIEKKKSTNISTNNNQNTNDLYNKNSMILFQNKIQELLLILKFFNSNKKFNYNTNNINNKIIDILNLNDEITPQKIFKTNIIDVIDEVIIKLNKQIINQGQIKRKNSIELEFEF